MSWRLPIAVALALPLAACGGVTGPKPGFTPAPAQLPPAAPSRPANLAGQDARALTRMFGTPRLDIREMSMRKLQFANGRCVLDAYLYPPARGKEPVVTHVDARTPAGADVDPASCTMALQGK
jgi:hypothetical protein